jgi:hypothetical protein
VLPLLLSSACSSFKDILPVEVKTQNNYVSFKQRFEKENGVLVFYALSVRDYETLSLNMSEIRRFLDQQKQIIVYYERAVTNERAD